MEKAEAKEWADRNIESLIKEYGIPHWEVIVEWVADKSDGAKGNCTASARYEHAYIELNYINIDDLKDLERILRHEIGHIVHAPFNMYRLAVEEALKQYPGSDPVRAVLDSSFDDAMELTVKNIERMHAGHKQAYLPDDRPTV